VSVKTSMDINDINAP